MNTGKTLTEKFSSRVHDYPIWFYKKLQEIEVDEVIFYLLKETFVVELNGKKIEMTFGKNRKHEIGCTQSCNEGLDYTSYKTIRKAFTEGKWFRVTDEDTTDEFKEDYKVQEAERERMSLREGRIDILTRAIEMLKSVSESEKSRLIADLYDQTDEELKNLTDMLFSSFSDKESSNT